MRFRLVTAACLSLLVAAPGFAATASDKGTAGSDTARADGSYVATVLDTTGSSLTLKKDSGEVVFLSYDEPGLTVKIDRGVTKNSRVTVRKESTAMSRTLIVQLAPAH